MVQEVGRRLVGGQWITNIADEGGGGGSVDADDVTVSPTVAGESNVQDALEALESGGSQPNLLTWTFTAAEIAAAFDVLGAAVIELTEIEQGDILEWAGETEAPTIDGDLAWGGLYSYTAATPTPYNAYNNGEGMDSDSPGGFSNWTVGTYNRHVSVNEQLNILQAGCSWYAVFTGTTPPTTGQVVFAAGIRRA